MYHLPEKSETLYFAHRVFVGFHMILIVNSDYFHKGH
jgi:hypothetical protein